MKKLITGVLFCGASLLSNAQINDHAIGIRSSFNYGLGRVALVYDYKLNANSRLNFGLSANQIQYGANTKLNIFRLSAHYQYVMNIKGGLNWFVGGGVYATSFLRRETNFNAFSQQVHIGPQIGLEYDFGVHNVPLLLNFTYSPGLTMNFDSQSTNYRFQQNGSVSLKYTFNNK